MNKTDVMNALAPNLKWTKGLDGSGYVRSSVLGFKIEIYPEAMNENRKPARYIAGHYTATSRNFVVIAASLKNIDAAKAAVVDWLATQIISLATAPEAVPVLQD